MKKHTFIWGAIILTIGGFVAKIIGAFYKIPLTNILGSTGMGLYYLVFPLYNLLLVFSSSGVSVAITRLVAEARAKKNKKNETKYFYAGILISLLLSVIFSIGVFVFAKQLAFLQGNILSYLSFLAISPAIIVASLVTVIKGYFQGVENMFPSSVSIIFEQIVKLVVGLILSFKLLPYGIEYAVMGSVLAVTISETLTFFLMLFNYVWNKKHNDYKFYIKDANTSKLKELKPKEKIVSKKAVKLKAPKEFKKIMYLANENKNITFITALKKTFKMMLPNTLMSLVMPLTTFVDSFLVINLLTKSGYSSLTATSLYGINNGVVSSLIALPVIITSSLATAVVPNLTGLIYLGKREEINTRSSFFIKITWVIVLPIFVFFLIMCNNIISALYNFGTNNVVNEYGFACKLLMLSSISIIYNALLSTFISILQAINKPYRVFFILLSGLFIRIILAVVMLQIIRINIFGIILANITFLLYCGILCLNEIRKSMQLNLNIFKSFVIPSIGAIISGCIMYILQLCFNNLNIWLNLVINGVVCVVVYFSFIYVCKCFDINDKRYLPFLKKITKSKK